MILVTLFWSAAALLLLTYVAYPLLATFIGSFRPANDVESRETAPPSLPMISCLVPAYNEASVIRQKILNFLSLDYPMERLEIIIGDDGSDDGTRRLVEEMTSEHVRLLAPQPRSGKAATMNRLVDAATHDLLFFSDANVMLESNALRILAGHLGESNVGAVTGEVTLIESGDEIRAGESAYYWMERRIQGAESHLGSVIGVDGGMYLVHRDRFSPLPIDTILDDFAVSMNVIRAGYRVVYDASAKAVETGTPSARQEFTRRIRIAAGAVQLVRRGRIPRLTQPLLLAQFVSHKLLRWLSPLLILVTISTSWLLRNEGNIYQAAFLIQTVHWLVTLATVFSQHLRTRGIGSIIFYFGMSQVAMLIGLAKGLLNRQSVRWESTSRGIENPAGDPNAS